MALMVSGGFGLYLAAAGLAGTLQGLLGRCIELGHEAGGWTGPRAVWADLSYDIATQQDRDVTT